MKKTLRELASLVNGQVRGDPSVEISGVAPCDSAGPGEITYVKGRKYLALLETTGASAVITPPGTVSKKNLLWADNPQLAFAKILGILYPRPPRTPGVHETACISPTAVLGSNVSIGPYTVIGENVSIGDGVVLHGCISIGDNSTVGQDTVIHPHVSIYEGTTIGKRVILHSGVVIGSDGFGYVRDGSSHFKIPQVGGVTIEDDVEIGANSTIDRATMGQTIIRRGVKIDNLVQVAHNVVIGENSIVVAQVGIAGSARVGSNVVLAGQVGIADHIEIGDNVIVGAQAGVGKDVPPNQVLQGSPTMPQRDFLRSSLLVARLPQIKRTLDALVRRIQKLEEKIGKD
ncbi:MAG: UDP-3-O-(3-hydroxymyristoyl)glucosamine N-acyltransferase [Deltaproteobacteria bacterium]|nr:UDP-3-O-(3-hydroxymyristoyl)glucosamine N-acyltransferase [Deltaproteobacteria bacterium]